jgi:hypothetical protein
VTTVDEQTRQAGASNPADAEVERFRAEWPQEFRLGYRFGILGKADAPCDSAGYPLGLHAWPLGRKNAWWCGWHIGRTERAEIREKRRR